MSYGPPDVVATATVQQMAVACMRNGLLWLGNAVLSICSPTITRHDAAANVHLIRMNVLLSFDVCLLLTVI